MKKKIIIGSIITVFLIIFTSLPSVVGYQTIKLKDIKSSETNDEIITAIQELKKTKDGWHLGFFIELLIGTIFIILILLGILTPD